VPCDDTAMTDLRDALRVKPRADIRLGHRDPGDTSGWAKDAAMEQMAKELDRLAELQDRLWAVEGAGGQMKLNTIFKRLVYCLRTPP